MQQLEAEYEPYNTECLVIQHAHVGRHLKAGKPGTQTVSE